MINFNQFPREKILEDAAVQFNNQGWAEAVLLAVCKASGQSYSCVPSIAAGFSVGMGGTGQVCGAVSGAVLAIGLIYREDLTIGAKAREITESFSEKYGALRCAELLGLSKASSDELVVFARQHKAKLCDKFVYSAVESILDMVEGSITRNS